MITKRPGNYVERSISRVWPRHASAHCALHIHHRLLRLVGRSMNTADGCNRRRRAAAARRSAAACARSVLNQPPRAAGDCDHRAHPAKSGGRKRQIPLLPLLLLLYLLLHEKGLRLGPHLLLLHLRVALERSHPVAYYSKGGELLAHRIHLLLLRRLLHEERPRLRVRLDLSLLLLLRHLRRHLLLLLQLDLLRLLHLHRPLLRHLLLGLLHLRHLLLLLLPHLHVLLLLPHHLLRFLVLLEAVEDVGASASGAAWRASARTRDCTRRSTRGGGGSAAAAPRSTGARARRGGGRRRGRARVFHRGGHRFSELVAWKDRELSVHSRGA